MRTNALLPSLLPVVLASIIYNYVFFEFNSEISFLGQFTGFKLFTHLRTSISSFRFQLN